MCVYVCVCDCACVCVCGMAGQGGGGSTVYCGMDQRTGENVAITEWVFKWRTIAKKAHFKAADLDEDKEGKAYLKQVWCAVLVCVYVAVFIGIICCYACVGQHGVGGGGRLEGWRWEARGWVGG